MQKVINQLGLEDSVNEESMLFDSRYHLTQRPFNKIIHGVLHSRLKYIFYVVFAALSLLSIRTFVPGQTLKKISVIIIQDDNVNQNY